MAEELDAVVDAPVKETVAEVTPTEETVAEVTPTVVDAPTEETTAETTPENTNVCLAGQDCVSAD